MKKNLLFSLMFFFFILFFARGWWLPTLVRLDTGDTPGANNSYNLSISSIGSNVYVVWEDYRNGVSWDNTDIYFNYSTNGGASWQASDIRLDTGDIPGASGSHNPQISSSGSNVYAVWEDFRNVWPDIYFNYSTDCGVTWQASDIRIDTGDTPGSNDSLEPQISSISSNVYVVWYDHRNGEGDIYFNHSTDGGVTWQNTSNRLDIGDSPGAKSSIDPQISSIGSNVYVVWDDRRNGGSDIYFNYSTDSGVTWQATDIRLDKGDPPGANRSKSPEISCSGSNVYVVWADERNGGWNNEDIYFNSSMDGGASWQASDIRIDTGDTPGASGSEYPQISSIGSNVFVVWQDLRNGGPDIYFNCSTDGGTTWQATEIRLDTGDPPGASGSWSSQISSIGSNVFVAWADGRNGASDIYFNTNSAVDPVPDIKANGSDRPITIARSDWLVVTVSIDTESYKGYDVDSWLVVHTPFPSPHDWYHYDLAAKSWKPGKSVSYQGAMMDLNLKKVLNQSGLRPGTYKFFFGVDNVMDGVMTHSSLIYDKVKVIVTN